MRTILSVLRATLIVAGGYLTIVYYMHSPRSDAELLSYLQYEANIILGFLVLGILKTFTSKKETYYTTPKETHPWKTR